MSDSPWWPLRSAYLAVPKLGHHIAAIALSVGIMVAMGALLAFAGNTAKGSFPVVGAATETFGLIVFHSYLVSWLWHGPLAIVLHGLMRWDRAGWAVVAFFSACIGVLLAELLRLPIAVPAALVGGVMQAWLLRRAALRRARVMK